MRLVSLGLCALAAPSLAQVPTTLGYQGRLLKSDGTPEAGVLAIKFSLYPGSTGGTAAWEETQQVALSDGFYSVSLGSVAAIPSTAFPGAERFLELTVGSGPPLSPRQKIQSVAYALMANTLPNDAVDTAMIQNGTIGFDDLASTAIGATATTVARGDHTHAAAVPKTIYVVYGRTTCGADPLVHTGYAGAFGGSQGAMSGEPMCLDQQMMPTNWNAWGAALVSRARSTTQTPGNRSEYMQTGDLTCAVCKGSAYALWGRTTCASGDTAIYTGHIAHFNYNVANGGANGAGPFCVDDAAPITWTNWGGNSIIARAAGASSNPYAQYLEARDGLCVVCR